MTLVKRPAFQQVAGDLVTRRPSIRDSCSSPSSFVYQSRMAYNSYISCLQRVHNRDLHYPLQLRYLQLHCPQQHCGYCFRLSRGW